MSKGIKMNKLAEMTGLDKTGISNVCTGRRRPMTDYLAKLCAALKVYPSEIVTFEDIEINDYFSKDKREPLPETFEGVLTYRPLWLFLNDYLETYNRVKGTEKTANDIFNDIEPPRRINGSKNPDKSLSEKSVAARYGEGYVSKRTSRTDYSKGLTAITRVKLRNDRPLNLEVIYEICKYIGCSIDFVMGYK